GFIAAAAPSPGRGRSRRTSGDLDEERRGVVTERTQLDAAEDDPALGRETGATDGEDEVRHPLSDGRRIQLVDRQWLGARATREERTQSGGGGGGSKPKDVGYGGLLPRPRRSSSIPRVRSRAQGIAFTAHRRPR